MSTAIDERLTLQREGDLAILTMVSEPLNLFDDRMIQAWGDRLAELTADPPRALLIRARGRAVSGGVDVAHFKGRNANSGGKLWQELFDGVIHPLESLPCPSLFEAHALTLTAAFEIALACDLLIASDNAKFGLVETVVGLTPSMGGPQRLADRAGAARARELVMTAGLYDAPTLRDWGVVNWVTTPDELEGKAREIAQGLAAGPTLAHNATRAIVKAWSDDGVEAADDIVPIVSGALFESEDLINAVDTFLSQGPGNATFNGR